jgi:serine/threonine protein kinase
MLSPGKNIGHYKILSRIGKGGMGEVYLAQDTKLGRKVAIKVLSLRFSRNSKKLKRFLKEAQTVSALNHPNIITIFEIGEVNRSRYITLEYVDGETLAAHLKKTQSLESLVDIAVQIGSALAAAHAAGIIHRDIKPDNVMIRNDGLVKVLDFGIAKLIRPEKADSAFGITEDETLIQEAENQEAESGLTVPGMVIGTANYMSPEQARGEEVDGRTDIFSFGVVFYKMVAGHLPFDGRNRMETIASIINKKPKPLTQADIPPEIKRIISKALRKDRDERYQTVKEMLADLKDFRQSFEFHKNPLEITHSGKEDAGTRILKADTVDEDRQTDGEHGNEDRQTDGEHGNEDRQTKEETGNDAVSSGKLRPRSLIAGVLTLLMLIAAAGWTYRYIFPPQPKQIRSIAVMPAGTRDDQKTLEDHGVEITSMLIERLAKVPEVRVRPSSLVADYKNKKVSPRQIGRELKVEAILLSKVRQKDRDFVLRLELVDTRSVNVIWSKTYEYRMEEFDSRQDGIIRDILANFQTRP